METKIVESGTVKEVNYVPLRKWWSGSHVTSMASRDIA